MPWGLSVHANTMIVHIFMTYVETAIDKHSNENWKKVFCTTICLPVQIIYINSYNSFELK